MRENGTAAELAALYEEIGETGLRALRERGGEADPFLRDPQRGAQRGLVLVLRPDRETAERIVSATREFDSLLPGAYCYPAQDLHITALELIKAQPGFACGDALARTYRQAVGEILAQSPAFSVVFRGLIASNSALMVCGFPQSGGLARLRGLLRAGLRARGLAPQERYETRSCHLTAVRFGAPAAERAAALALLARHARTDFGETEFGEAQLVCQNCFGAQRETLARFCLR